MPTPLDGKYLKAPTYDQVFDVTSDWLNKSSVGTFYKYAVLTPKAGSQIAKTILSPLTHVRNLLSAGAFVVQMVQRFQIMVILNSYYLHL